MTPQMRILVQKEGKFRVNMDFKSAKKRLMFPIPILEAVVKQVKINQDRTHAVDAAIVKVMKSRNRLAMIELRTKVIMLMQTFKPDDQLIKRRVDALIEREYIEFDKNDANILVYKA
mmetsp:Transcript_15028/g.25543  ORF Transcript_15028/g.25543 Transcript_15028/m.25543 type:complete len:117 (-) Transcript_15028:43-393(-)